MRKHNVVVFLLILSLGGLTSAIAQDDTGTGASWEVVLYDPDDETLIFVEQEGITETLPVPRSAFGEQLIPQRISPDHRYLAGALLLETEAVPAIADLEAGTCCIELPTAAPVQDSSFISFSRFSPDLSRIVYSYTTYDYQSDAQTGAGYTAVVDMETGTTTAEFTLPNEIYAYMQSTGEWEGDLVSFFPAPALPGMWYEAGFASQINIATGVISESRSIYLPFFGDRLPRTDELVVGVLDTTLPNAGIPGMFPPSNAVHYFPDGSTPVYSEANPTGGGNRIFYDPRALDVAPRWVKDGQAVLIQNIDYYAPDRRAYLLERGGQPRPVSGSQDLVWIAGTPDGWLMFRQTGVGAPREIFHFTNATNGGTLLGIVGETFTVIDSPLLGETASGGFQFSTWQPPAAPMTANCAGTLPSRLVVGERAWVLPGPANNVRDRPTTGGTRLFQLPGSEVFDVLEGPVCADGYAWWRVRNAFGEDGWTAEASNEEYWLEPLDVPNSLTDEERRG